MATPRKRAKTEQKRGKGKEEGQDNGNTVIAEGKGKSKGETFEFFYGPHCVFSQFHPCRFTVDDMEYNCMEQYMHHQKAVVFRDKVHAKEIMKTEEPRKQKALGRKVENFDKDVWKIESMEVVRKGNLEKYRQNPELRKILFDTHPRTLVEASPRDRIWGIGMGKNNPDARDRSKWRGGNRLGQILTKVRDALMEESKNRQCADGMETFRAEDKKQQNPDEKEMLETEEKNQQDPVEEILMAEDKQNPEEKEMLKVEEKNQQIPDEKEMLEAEEKNQQDPVEKEILMAEDKQNPEKKEMLKIEEKNQQDPYEKEMLETEEKNQQQAEEKETLIAEETNQQ